MSAPSAVPNNRPLERGCDVISDYDYDALNGLGGKFETDSFFYLIGAYEKDAISEAEGDTGESRCDIRESHGDLTRSPGPAATSPKRKEKEARKDKYPKNVKISSCQTAVWYGDAQRSGDKDRSTG